MPLPKISAILAYQADFISSFLETDCEIWNPNTVIGDVYTHLNFAAPILYESAGIIKCEFGPRLRREAQIQTAGANDSQGELLICFDQQHATSGLVSERSILKIGNDYHNIRFELNYNFQQEPLALVVAEKRSAPPER